MCVIVYTVFYYKIIKLKCKYILINGRETAKRENVKTEKRL